METNRRAFFRKVGQLTCLSVLIGGTGILLTNNQVRLNGCGDNQFCESCRKIDHCKLDPAVRQRNNNEIKQSSNHPK